MIALIGAIVGLIALGCLVAYAIVLTIRWLKNKIKEKLAKKNVKKVAVADIEQLIAECDNTVSMDELEKLTDEGYSHIMVDVGYDGKIVGDISVIEDKNDYLDEEVEQLLSRKGMVVVEE
ncbi:MAG: hypothetical protein J5590_05235 [Clostridia bacterium]|nr:hypothetical protein [Clostridia bacterium]